MPKPWQDRVIESELKYWGFWHGIQLAADGHSPESTIKELMGGDKPVTKDKILVIDPPKRWWPIHRTILSLTYDHRKVLIAQYCVPPQDDGRMRTMSELATILKWSRREYLNHLWSAKRAYKLKVF